MQIQIANKDLSVFSAEIYSHSELKCLFKNQGFYSSVKIGKDKAVNVMILCKYLDFTSDKPFKISRSASITE